MEPERICRKDLIPATGTFQRSERAASYFEEGKEAEFVSAGELEKSEALPPARIIATHRARATGGASSAYTHKDRMKSVMEAIG